MAKDEHNFTHTSIAADTSASSDASDKKEAPQKKKKSKRKKKRIVHTKKDATKINEQLAEIYKDQDGSLPDMTHFVRKERRRFARALVTLVASIAALSAVVWAGFFVFAPPSSFSEADIIVSISGDEDVTIGEQVRYRIRYRNAQRLALSQVHIQVRYPDGFVFEESSIDPDSESNDSWTIGALGSGDSGFIDVFGSMYADVGAEQSLRTFFTYIPVNFSSEFQKVATARVRVADAPASLSVDYPDNSRSGVTVPLNILVDVNQEQQDTIAAMAVEIDPGSVFAKQQESIESDKFQEYRWTVAGEENPFPLQVKGIFSGTGEVSIPVRVLGWTEGEQRRDEAFVLAEEQLTVSLEQTGVEIRPVVNGASSALTITPGEPLSTTIVVRNNGEEILKNVRVRAIFDAPSHNNRSILHWAAIDDPADGDIVGEQLSDDTRRGYIRWNSRHIPALRQIEPGQEIAIDLILPVKSDEETALANFRTYTAELSSDVQFDLEEGTDIISSEPVLMTIQSDLLLDVRDKVTTQGNGNDRHAITWVLSNTFHDLTDITLEADVYGATAFEEASVTVPAGEIAYDSDAKKLTWTIPQMPRSIDVLALPFTLTRLERNASQTQLMSKVTVKATDNATGEEIFLIGDEILLDE